MCSFSLVLFTAGLLFGQVEIAVVGGVPLSKVVDSSEAGGRLGYSRVDGRTNSYILGTAIRVPLAGPFRFQGGISFRRFSADAYATGIAGSTRSRFTGNQWDLPLLVTMPVQLSRRWQAYAGVGLSFRFVQGVREIGELRLTPLFAPPQFTPIDTASPASFTRRTTVGLAVEAGLRWRAGALALSPAIRSTQWDSERTAQTPVGTRYARPQVDALLTVHYVRGADRQNGVSPRFGYAVLAAYTPRALGRSTSAEVRAARFAAGALLEWKLRPAFALEGSFLLRRVGHRESYLGGSSTEWSANAWEVPLLLRRAPVRWNGRWNFGLGPAARFLSHQEIRFGNVRYASGFRRSSLGVAASAGLRHKAGQLLLRPEFRYQWLEGGPYNYYPIRFAQHQFWLVIGVGR